ncbi:MAG: ATP-NAD kinase [Candidatus Lokiarchaeota archaeon]|nr:ATP-NAD kinase [Candidatus Lokiarchaeota archaeon]MBD3340883.1 ATP-NAD kinase [Candidatus Lokiarchaeota archaeon]
MAEFKKFILGLIINPISGMGGSVGLKGTDGKKILNKAIQLGAQPNARHRAEELFNNLVPIRSRLKIISAPFMGAEVVRKLDFDYHIIHHFLFEKVDSIYDTTAQHTQIAAEKMKKIDDLRIILFVGGDGTARDVLDSVNMDKPCLGIPAGVKIYSSVFSLNPRTASDLITQFLWDEVPLKKSEVLDIDEEAYRQGRLVSKLYGYLLTPFNPSYSQGAKLGTPDSDLSNQEGIAKKIVENLKKDTFYLIGPGTTTKAITDALDLPKSVLGVDVLYNNKILAQDVNERQILELIKGKKSKIIVSPIGRQGFLFGRGNLQISAKVLKLVGVTNIIVISTRYKLHNILGQTLKLDTRSSETDNEFSGLYRVIVNYDEYRICKVQ